MNPITKDASLNTNSRVREKETHKIPIYHMASMARSGETLMLRTLEAHSNIRTVHNLFQQDSKESLALFNLLQNYNEFSIASSIPEVQAFNVRSNEILLLKQGAYEHQSPFQGFILVRNPLSIYVSLKKYDNYWSLAWWRELIKGKLSKKNCPTVRGRLSRWFKCVDSQIAKGVGSLSEIELFCAFYNRKMFALFQTGLPIVHYEHFVQKPEETLRRLLPLLGLEFTQEMLKAETFYPAGMVGHGKNDLTRKIDRSSLQKYQELSRKEHDRILALTWPTMSIYGYEVDSEGIHANLELLHHREVGSN